VVERVAAAIVVATTVAVKVEVMEAAVIAAVRVVGWAVAKEEG